MVSGAAGIPVITAQETGAAPPGGRGGWGRWGDYDEVSSAGKASACQPRGMTEGRFSRTMTAGELVYFGGVDQMMMGDFYTTKGF